MGDGFDLRAEISSDAVTRALGEELVLLNLATETYYGLDGIGAHMWEALSGSPTIEAAFEQLRFEYDVDPSTLRTDLKKLVDDLVASGLISLHLR